MNRFDDDDPLLWRDSTTASEDPLLSAGKGIVYTVGAFINGSVTCVAWIVGVLFFFSILLAVLGTCGGLLWAVLWFLIGLPLSFALVGIVSFPLRFLGAVLMTLGQDSKSRQM